MTLSHNKHKKEQQERGERRRLVSLQAISKRGWQRSKEKARAKRRRVLPKP